MPKKRIKGQMNMFDGKADDTPLISGSPMSTADESYTPAETPAQGSLFAATFDELAGAKQTKRQRKAQRKAAGSLRGMTFGDDIKSERDAMPLWLLPDDSTAVTPTQDPKWLAQEDETPTPTPTPTPKTLAQAIAEQGYNRAMPTSSDITPEKRPTPHDNGRHMLVVPGVGARRELTAFQVMIVDCTKAGTADWRYTTLVIDNDHNRRLHDAADIAQGVYLSYYHDELKPVNA